MTAETSVRIGILLVSDDTALLSLMLNDWCDRLYLCLNATKTKDMCIYFKKYSPSQSDTVIHDNKVEVVDEYKYLGTKLTITWSVTATAVSHTRNVSSVFNASENFALLTLIAPFCPCFINLVSSVLKFSFKCWFVNVSQKDKNKLQRVVNISSKITGFKLSSHCFVRKAGTV